MTEEKPRVLRSKKDGYIYWWTPELSKRDDMEEIPYEEAFPPPPEPKTDTPLPPKAKITGKKK